MLLVRHVLVVSRTTHCVYYSRETISSFFFYDRFPNFPISTGSRLADSMEWYLPHFPFLFYSIYRFIFFRNNLAVFHLNSLATSDVWFWLLLRSAKHTERIALTHLSTKCRVTLTFKYPQITTITVIIISTCINVYVIALRWIVVLMRILNDSFARCN